jgi:DNA mismatch endonuclease (patch repair protein)
MADVLTPEQRRLNMKRIKAKDTKPELLLRNGLHQRGYRFRLHRKDLPGRPDIVFPKYRAVIFVNGCFWHMHDCHLFRLPETRRDFWHNKLSKNAERDKCRYENLQSLGWRVLIIWECAVKGKKRLPFEEMLDHCESFLSSETCLFKQIPGGLEFCSM